MKKEDIKEFNSYPHILELYQNLIKLLHPNF